MTDDQLHQAAAALAAASVAKKGDIPSKAGVRIYFDYVDALDQVRKQQEKE